MRVFLVCGPESSGNHLVTRILLDSGCKGSMRANQKLREKLKKKAKPIVYRGSQPRKGKWWNMTPDIVAIKNHGYEIQAIVPVRNYLPMAKSAKKKHGRNNDGHAFRLIDKAYIHIFTQLMNNSVPFVFVSYEALVHSTKDTIRSLSRAINLKLADTVEVYDGNEKWMR